MKNRNYIEKTKREDNLIAVVYKDFYPLSEKRKIRYKNMRNDFAQIASFFLDYLKSFELAVIYKKFSDGALIFDEHEEIPVMLKVINYVDLPSSQIFNRKKYEELPVPYYQYFSGENFSPIPESQLIAFDIIAPEESKALIRRAFKVNILLKSFFERRNARLLEFNSLFGKKNDSIFFIGDCSPLSLKVKLNSDDNFENYLEFKRSLDLKKYTMMLKGLIQ